MHKEKYKGLQKLITDYEALDKESRWFYLNRLWYLPESRNIFFSLFVDFWEQEGLSNPNLPIVIPEGISSSFGILPFVSALAQQKGNPLIVWKEFGDILTTEPYLFPERKYILKHQGLEMSCLVVQDTINKGTTLIKMSSQLENLGFKVHKYVGVLQFLEGETDLEENLAQLDPVLADNFDVVRMAYIFEDLQVGELENEALTISNR